MAEIQLRNVNKRWGSFVGVDNFDLTIADQEFLVLLGPSGCGKTTTMRMIAGLIQPTSGNISIAGHDLAREALAARAVCSFIPDRPYLYEKLTGLEFLKFSADLYGVDARRFPGAAHGLLERFSLTDWENELIEAYSHGMKQRLVIAAALAIQDPRERPEGLEAQADQMHARYRDEGSDLVTWLNLWRYLHEERRSRSSSQFRRMCRKEYLNYLRVRGWMDLFS